ncbi:hypothetical protein [Rhizobium rhizoryzae]|uniref:hypothetical protein n=1 Tax=Rhizobium rhizoryzae TaxID=451876 RepID=UPI00289AB56C|nr:hypothetical protein [Rhizobium rhizoryzae]
MQIENLTKPGVAPVDGDLVRITHDSGTVETKQFWTPVARVDPPPAEPVDDISDRQFFQALAVRGDITETEALDAVGPGIIPPAMDALIDQLPQDQRFAARMLIRGATRYERQHPIADLIRSLYGWSNEDADDFWRFAATL